MKLIDKLPYFYEECPTTNTIQEGLQSETDNLYRKVDNTIDQLYINSATWALDMWEEFVDIKNPEGTVEQRRSSVSAKLKAKGTTTLDVMTALCKSYIDDVKVTELFNEYTILLQLISNSESFLPKEYNLTDINSSIWEVKPAHLAHEFDFVNSRKLNIKTAYEDAKFRYIPCNTIYAGELQPNTYFNDNELSILPPSEIIEMGVI